MCGIVGIVHRDPSRPVPSKLIARMCDAIMHRGPDDFGEHLDGHIGLGMRRLSIIDLQTGRQPMANEDGTVWVVFNGEIYNYRELRNDLEARGHRFRTTSDTEVIVHLYEEYGQDCVDYLRGMFAFAVWDTSRQVLMLARDRLGIKPLYYSETPEGLAFASELKALLVDPRVSRELDPEALSEFFTHLCVPAPLSIFRSVRKLPAAHVLSYRQGQVHLRRYWQVQPDPDYGRTADDWIDELRGQLSDAVRSHMVADVPVGAFLSGGLDSGSMVALMAHASSTPIRTFTVGFKTEAGRFDERESAKVIATRYGTSHHECLLDTNVTDILPRIVRTFDEPFADSSAIPNWLICRETSQHVKVALSGLGGDELFGGYPRYVGLHLADRYRQIPRPLRLAIGKLVQNLPNGSDTKYFIDRVKRFVNGAELITPDRYRHFIAAFQDTNEILDPEVIAALRGRPTRYEEVIGSLSIHDPVDIGLYSDQYLYLPDDLLTLTDRVSMAHSLEVRVPFLDHKLVEFAARIPARFKVRGFQRRLLFRQAIAPWIPRGHLRRPKQGFSVPMAAWLRGPLRAVLNDLVSSRECRESPYLKHAGVRRLVDGHITKRANHETRLWALICFIEWQRQYLGSSRERAIAGVR